MPFGELSGVYERKAFLIPNLTAFGSWKTLATAFVKVKRSASAVIISDQDLTLKFGKDPANDEIPVTAAQFPFSWVGDFEDILIDNQSGVDANVSVILR